MYFSSTGPKFSKKTVEELADSGSSVHSFSVTDSDADSDHDPQVGFATVPEVQMKPTSTDSPAETTAHLTDPGSQFVTGAYEVVERRRSVPASSGNRLEIQQRSRSFAQGTQYLAASRNSSRSASRVHESDVRSVGQETRRSSSRRSASRSTGGVDVHESAAEQVVERSLGTSSFSKPNRRAKGAQEILREVGQDYLAELTEEEWSQQSDADKNRKPRHSVQRDAPSLHEPSTPTVQRRDMSLILDVAHSIPSTGTGTTSSGFSPHFPGKPGPPPPVGLAPAPAWPISPSSGSSPRSPWPH